MTDLTKAFLLATEEVKRLASTPEDAILLDLYAYYKQATVGDNSSDKPSFFDIKGCKKWSAWMQVKGMAREAAMLNYITIVRRLKMSAKQ